MAWTRGGGKTWRRTNQTPTTALTTTSKTVMPAPMRDPTWMKTAIRPPAPAATES
jgi:hypothetical protein